MANVLTIHRDLKGVGNRRSGAPGADGVNGSGVADIRESIVGNPILDLFYNNKLSKVGAVTWDRSGEAVITDRYGVDQWVSGDDITNDMTQSNDFTMWSDPFNRWTRVGSTTDPLGGGTATEISLDETLTADQAFVGTVERSVSGLTAGKVYTVSFDFKLLSGSISEIQITAGGVYFDVTKTVTTSYQRLTVTFFSAVSSLLFSIHPVGTSGSTFALYEVMYEIGSTAHAPINTTVIPVTISGTDIDYRASDNGYLFEGMKGNLVVNSEDLLQTNWALSSGAIEEGTDTYGQIGKNIVVNINSLPTATLKSTGAFTNNTLYTLSFDASIVSGSVNASASINGSAPVDFGILPTGEIKRLSFQIISGTGASELEFSITSSNLSGRLLLTSIQVEVGSLSSYIRNAASSNSRPLDLVTVPYNGNVPNINAAWTLFFNSRLIPVNSDIKYILTNGETGANELSLFFESTDLKLKTGNTTHALSNATSSEIAIVYDGVNIVFYINSVLMLTIPFVINIDNSASTMFFGAGSGGLNALFGFLLTLKFFDESLTIEEIKYLSGV